MEGAVYTAVLIKDYPCYEEVYLSVFPKVQQFGFVVFQKDNIDHLCQVFEVCGQGLLCDVFDHRFHPSFLGQLCNHFHLVHGYKYTFGRYRPKTSMAASRPCSFVRLSYPVMPWNWMSESLVIPALGGTATKGMA